MIRESGRRFSGHSLPGRGGPERGASVGRHRTRHNDMAKATAKTGRDKNRRDPDRTREAILRAAQDEFAAKGLFGGRVNMIAREAGANKRMIYHYFGSKEGLYLAALERVY